MLNIEKVSICAQIFCKLMHKMWLVFSKTTIVWNIVMNLTLSLLFIVFRNLKKLIKGNNCCKFEFEFEFCKEL